MAGGDFLSGLSEGIFERQNQLRQEQEVKDLQGKQDIVRMLTGLADKVEPDSLPLLMGHIWDTMGIKKQSSGKGLRGFLDAFSGMPNRSVEDQLGTKLREVTSGMVGPQAAKDTRLRNNIAQKGILGLVQAAPDSAYGQQAAAGANDLKNKMVFRDPYRQRVEEIEARYGAQLENQRARDAETHASQVNRLLLTHDLNTRRDQDKYNRRVESDVDVLAGKLMNDPDVLLYHPSQRQEYAKQKARTMLSRAESLGIENKAQDIEVKKAVVAEKKNNLTGGGSPSAQVSKQRLGHTLLMDRGKYQEAHDQADAKVKSLTVELEEAGKAVDEFAAKMAGMTREKLASSWMAGMGKGPVVTAVQKYNKLKRDLEAATQDRETKKKQLDEYDKTQGGTKPQVTRPKLPSKGRKQATPPQAMTPPGGETFDATTLPSSTKSGTDQNTYKIRADRTNAMTWKEGQIVNPPYLKGNWKVGEEIDENGIKYKVIRRVP